jgi:hypothetical protein
MSTPLDWMDEIASESVLNQAYAWLCDRLRDYSPNDDVWDVLWRWDQIRPHLQEWLRAGVYRIGAAIPSRRRIRSARHFNRLAGPRPTPYRW